MIRSVLGRIDPAQLGVTLLHAHSTSDHDALTTELDAFRLAGGNTVIEARIPAWQRSLKRLIEVGWAGQLLVGTRQCGTLDDSINAIRTAGFSHDLVDDLLVRNPRRYLAADPR